MPIKIGNTTIGAIYKGSTPIAKIYKGTTLLYENASWELFSQQYLYYTLIPQTINSKSVKNKAKVSKIYGNGEIVNQLVKNGNFVDGDVNWANAGGSYVISGGKATFTQTQASDRFKQLNVVTQANHKYLIIGLIMSDISTTVSLEISRNWLTASKSLTANVKTLISNVVTPTATSDSFNMLQIFGGGACVLEIYEVMLVDLTLMFGTGNEPTTLTDNRIQNILNRGYIPYNLGEYKGTDIGEFKSEPYNLFNTERVVGNAGDWNYTSKRAFKEGEYYLGLTANNYCSPTQISNYSSSNGSVSFSTGAASYGVAFPMRVVGGKSYTLEYTSDDSGDVGTRYISWYDQEGNFISYESGVGGKTAPQNAYWGVALLRPASSTSVVTYTNVCFHLTGTRTGYAEHKTFTPITFKAQLGGAINSHDTFEITNTSYVITRNAWKVDLGSLDYTYQSSEQRFLSSVIPTMKSAVATRTMGILCPKYYCICDGSSFSSSWNKAIYNGSNAVVYIHDHDYIDATTLKSSLSGTYAHYPLATPQVITIPRKHLAVVDLGSLSWQSLSSGANERSDSSGLVGLIKPVSSNSVKPNIFSNIYVNATGNENYVHTYPKAISVSTAGMLSLYDVDLVGKTGAEIKSALSGQYLFYETENEVADITDTIDIESGGTITTDSEVLPNVDLSVKCK